MSSTEGRKPKKRASCSVSQPFEHADAGGRHPSNVKYPRPEDPLSQNRLRDPLYDKDLLRKIFAYLVEDGLHECRRVCRKWREVCSEFFTKSFRGHWKDLAEAHLTFPRAVNVSLSFRAPPSFFDNLNAWPNIVPSLTSVKRLEMDATFLQNCPCFVQFPPMICEYVASLVQLESLTVGVLDGCTYSLIASMAAHLTNLTHLKIGSAPSLWHMQPVPGVSKLESLSLQAVNLLATDEFFNILTGRGTLTFPSLTNLTRLKIRCESYGDVIRLEVCDILPLTLLLVDSTSVLDTRALCIDSEILGHLLHL